MNEEGKQLDEQEVRVTTTTTTTSTAEDDDIYEQEVFEQPWRALVVGATGKTGRQVVRHLLQQHASCESVTVLLRADLSTADTMALFGVQLPHQSVQLKTFLVSFDELSYFRDQFRGYDKVFCCIGARTTSARDYEHVDYTLAATIAQYAKDGGTSHLSIISCDAAAADAWRSFRRWKGRLEDECVELRYKRLSIFRPYSLHDEDASSGVVSTLRRLSDVARPIGVMSVDVKQLARAMVTNAVRMKRARIEVYENKNILTMDVGRRVETVTVHLDDDDDGGGGGGGGPSTPRPKLSRMCVSIFQSVSPSTKKSRSRIGAGTNGGGTTTGGGDGDDDDDDDGGGGGDTNTTTGSSSSSSTTSTTTTGTTTKGRRTSANVFYEDIEGMPGDDLDDVDDIYGVIVPPANIKNQNDDYYAQL